MLLELGLGQLLSLSSDRKGVETPVVVQQWLVTKEHQDKTGVMP